MIELLIFFIYLFISLIFCILISIFKLHSLIYYSSFLIFKLTKKKLLVLNSFDIFLIVNNLIIFYVFMCILPLLNFYFYNFISNGFYIVQLKKIKSFFLRSNLFNFVLFVVFNLLLLLILLSFLLCWNFMDNLNSYALFEIQLKLYDYIFLWINLNYKLLFFMNLIFLFCYIIKLFIDYNKIYKFYYIYKNQFLFFYIFLSNILINEFYLQFIFLIIILVFEIIFFYLCYKNVKFYF